MRRILLLFAAVLTLWACGNDPIAEPQPTPGNPQKTDSLATSRAVLVYMVAENSLDPFLNEDFRELIAGHKHIPADGQVVVYMDDRRAPRLYRLTAEKDTALLYTWPSDICSTDSASMCRVFDKMMECTAGTQHYDLVMGSHASGWIPRQNRFFKTRSFGIDNNSNGASNSGVEMDITTLAYVLAGHTSKFGYIFFDACYMQCIEVAHQLRDCADYIVASPTEIPGSGANYYHIMPALFDADNAPERIVEQYYADEKAKPAAYGGVVISAISTAQTSALALAAQPIVAQLCSGRTTPNTEGVQTYGPATSSKPPYHDMRSLALQTSDQAALDAFRIQLDRTIVAYRATKTWLTIFNWFTPEIPDITRTCGASMFLPDNAYSNSGLNEMYHTMDWYRDANWAATGW